MDGLIELIMDGWMDGWMDGPTKVNVLLYLARLDFNGRMLTWWGFICITIFLIL